MINELADLAVAMKQADVSAETRHRKYQKIRAVTEKNPCIRITLSDGRISQLESVTPELGEQLYTYGSNQGTFPAMNLQPLYRMTDAANKKSLKNMLQGKQEPDLQEIRSWCVEKNWGKKFRKKYKNCFVNVPNELKGIFTGSDHWVELETLFSEAEYFTDSDRLFGELEKKAFELIEKKVDLKMAFSILFHQGNANKEQENDSGKLTVILDSQKLIDAGYPVASVRFTKEFNRRLVEADENRLPDEEETVPDAFGVEFVQPKKSMPMPSVKLAGGFKVTLRTMYHGQPCQERYGKIDDASYPLSSRMRTDLASALEWLGNKEHQDIFWQKTDEGEILFAYPDQLPPSPPSFVKLFKRIKVDREKQFEQVAKEFLKDMNGLHRAEMDSNADHIQVFILRKIDDARSKVIYTRITDPQEIERCSDSWSAGRDNLPDLSIGKPVTPFPIDSADILNKTWKQNGEPANDKFRPIPSYHGMELFFDAEHQASTDLSILIRNMEVIAPLLGRILSDHTDTGSRSDPEIKEKKKSATKEQSNSGLVYNMKQSVALMGFLLLELGYRKEQYMQDFAYQYGQLLKISDELHLLYCRAVRDGNVPPQLAGGSMYMSVSDAPIRTLGVLGDRMNPYITWANTYQYKDCQEKDIESRRAGGLLGLYQTTAGKIREAMEKESVSRFTDAQKAELFLGYISDFPRSKSTNKTEENGGNDDV